MFLVDFERCMANVFRLQGGRKTLTESENEQRGRGKRGAKAKGTFEKVSSGDESDESLKMAKTVLQPQVKVKKPNPPKCGTISKMKMGTTQTCTNKVVPPAAGKKQETTAACQKGTSALLHMALKQ